MKQETIKKRAVLEAVSELSTFDFSIACSALEEAEKALQERADKGEPLYFTPKPSQVKATREKLERLLTALER